MNILWGISVNGNEVSQLFEAIYATGVVLARVRHSF